MSSPRLTAAALLAIAALFAAACDTDPEPEVDEAPPVEEEPQDALDPDQPPEPAAIDIEPVRVTYMATMDDADDEELTVSWDPPQVAVIFEGGRFIHTEEHGTLLCSMEEEENVCSQIPGDGAGPEQVLQSFVPFFAAAATAPQDIPGAEPTDGREIAGRDAECFLITPPEGPDVQDVGTAELCADVESGATLLYSFTDETGAEQSVEATAVGSPEADDFEPTGPITEAEMPGEAPPADE